MILYYCFSDNKIFFIFNLGEKISEIACESPTFTVAWHPKRHLLAYACDDKYERDRDAGNVKVYGFPNSSDNSW